MYYHAHEDFSKVSVIEFELVRLSAIGAIPIYEVLLDLVGLNVAHK